MSSILSFKVPPTIHFFFFRKASKKNSPQNKIINIYNVFDGENGDQSIIS